MEVTLNSFTRLTGIIYVVTHLETFWVGSLISKHSSILRVSEDQQNLICFLKIKIMDGITEAVVRKRSVKRCY